MKNKIVININEVAVDGIKPIDIKISHKINEIPQAIIVFEAKKLDSLAKLSPFNAGDKIKIFNQIEKKKEIIFQGIIIYKEMQNDKNNARLKVIAKHPLQKLVHTLHSEIFIKQKNQDIIKTLLDESGLAIHIATKANILKQQHEQIVQFHCSDWQFLLSRLFATNTFLLPLPEEIKVISFDDYDSKTYSTDPSYLKNAYWEFDARYNSDSIEVRSWDIQEQKSTTSSKTQKTQLGKNGFALDSQSSLAKKTWEISYSNPLSSVEAEALAKSALVNQRISSIKAEFQLIGYFDYKIGNKLLVEKYHDSYSGEGIITGVSYHISQMDRWTTTLKLGMDATAQPLVPSVSELHVGIVKESKETDLLDRIPVSLPVLNKDNKTLLARLGKPYASKESGFCFYPEPGDEVIIGFLGNNPCYPVILGAMHNPKNKTPIEHNKDNLQKALIVKHGENKKQLIINNKENTFELQSGEKDKNISLSLSKDEKITLESNSLKLDAKNDILIKSAKIDLEK